MRSEGSAMGVWKLIQDEILGMKWLNRVIGNGLSLFGLDIDGRLGGSVQFFLYDVIKITVLLCFLIFVISYIQSIPSASFRCPDTVRFHTGQSGDDFQKIQFLPERKRIFLPYPFEVRAHYHCGNGNRFFATGRCAVW